MSHTHPLEAHHVKKGNGIMLKGMPCKVVDVKTSKTGKHGHAKCNITGIDVISGRKYNEVHPGHIVLAAFDAKKDEYELCSVDEADNSIEVIDEAGATVTINIENDEGHALMKSYEEFPDKIYLVTTMTAPVGEGDKSVLTTAIDSWKIDASAE
jgi:translation initiation factor 5A